MKRKLTKIICAGLSAVLLITGSTTVMAADSLSSVFPAAGNSRVLGEGVSVATIKAQKADGADRSGKSVVEITSDVVAGNSSSSSTSASSSSKGQVPVAAISLTSTSSDEKGSDSSSVATCSTPACWMPTSTICAV